MKAGLVSRHIDPRFWHSAAASHPRRAISDVSGPRRRLSWARDGRGLVFPYANAHAMNLHLEETSCQVTQGSHAVLLLD
jgi:hypothetical protein